MSWNIFYADGRHNAQPKYDQFQYDGCAVGCGAVAWAILIGWADRQAAFGNTYWSGRFGLYRENGGRGANVVAPKNMDDGIKNIIREIRNDIGTFCSFGSGATYPSGMSNVRRYLSGRTNTRIRIHYNGVGIHETRLRNYARNSIRYRKTPAIIGTGWLSHYPVAYGYAWRSRVIRKCFFHCWNKTVYDRRFYVNQGWGGRGNDWVNASTWFAGEILP